MEVILCEFRLTDSYTRSKLHNTTVDEKKTSENQRNV